MTVADALATARAEGATWGIGVVQVRDVPEDENLTPDEAGER